jgi:pimeloyl-ACP methyl ester carboxylesterase
MQVEATSAVELYHEVRGDGTPILFVPGIPGDAAQFAAVAGELARDHTVITYDRRANSRSPRPAGWNATSLEEQVADAAAMLQLGGGASMVYGSSVGAIVALELARSLPDLVSVALLHEMPLISVLVDPIRVASGIGEIVEPAFARGGPDAALEAFLRFAFGDAIVDQLDPQERARMISNGEVAMTIELPVFQSYRPDPATLRGLHAHALVGADEAVPFFHEAAAWLAEAIGNEVVEVAGAHGPQFDRPRELAAQIRRFAA